MDEQDREIEELTMVVFDQYGYDFRDYAPAAFKRRILGALTRYGCQTIRELRSKIESRPEAFFKLLNDLTLTVTEMFRDASVYKFVRSQVIPHLRTYPELKVWHAGCSSGEEVYSLCIVLKEEGLYDRSIIYATDINPAALEKAKEGILPIASLKEASVRYFAAGGTGSLGDYYVSGYRAAMLDASLRKNVVFADHNLATDEAFGEMHLIFCRNVLIYFNKSLQNRVLKLFFESLTKGGFLCLGSREALPSAWHGGKQSFEIFNREGRVFRKSFVPGGALG